MAKLSQSSIIVTSGLVLPSTMVASTVAVGGTPNGKWLNSIVYYVIKQKQSLYDDVLALTEQSCININVHYRLLTWYKSKLLCGNLGGHEKPEVPVLWKGTSGSGSGSVRRGWFEL